MRLRQLPTTPLAGTGNQVCDTVRKKISAEDAEVARWTQRGFAIFSDLCAASATSALIFRRGKPVADSRRGLLTVQFCQFGDGSYDFLRLCRFRQDARVRPFGANRIGRRLTG